MGFFISFLIKTVVYAGAVYIASQIIDDFTITGDWRILATAGFLLAAGYTILRPVLKIVTFPLAIITLGFSNALINAAILWGVDWLLADMTINGIVPLIAGTLLISVASLIFSLL